MTVKEAEDALRAARRAEAEEAFMAARQKFAAARVHKIAAEPRALDWLSSPHRLIVVHAWRKVKRAGRDRWELREVPLVRDGATIGVQCDDWSA